MVVRFREILTRIVGFRIIYCPKSILCSILPHDGLITNNLTRTYSSSNLASDYPLLALWFRVAFTDIEIHLISICRIKVSLWDVIIKIIDWLSKYDVQPYFVIKNQRM